MDDRGPVRLLGDGARVEEDERRRPASPAEEEERVEEVVVELVVVAVVVVVVVACFAFVCFAVAGGPVLLIGGIIVSVLGCPLAFYSSCKQGATFIDWWMDGWMGGWVD